LLVRRARHTGTVGAVDDPFEQMLIDQAVQQGSLPGAVAPDQ
jgi:hypothetical protein